MHFPWSLISVRFNHQVECQWQPPMRCLITNNAIVNDNWSNQQYWPHQTVHLALDSVTKGSLICRLAAISNMVVSIQIYLLTWYCFIDFSLDLHFLLVTLRQIYMANLIYLKDRSENNYLQVGGGDFYFPWQNLRAPPPLWGLVITMKSGCSPWGLEKSGYPPYLIILNPCRCILCCT